MKELWQDLVPYLQKAIRLSGELAALRAEREMLIAFIDELPTPLFLVQPARVGYARE